MASAKWQKRVDSGDWDAITAELNDFGGALLPRLLTKAEAEALGKLQVFMGVSEFPARVKCASLAWHTLKAALENVAEPVTTEEAKDGTSGA